MANESTKSQKTIWQKLMEIQKAHISFAKTESSGTADPKDSSKPSYSFTPGWEIVEAIRKLMDERNLMMPMNIVSEVHEMIDRPIYKFINNTLFTLQQRMNHSVIKVEYYFIDTETGERTETFTMFADGANGLDKSTATALSYAERNIFLKTFHISTKDKFDEPDAQDSNFVSGFDQQPKGMTDKDLREASKAGASIQQPQAPSPQQVTTSPAPAPAPATRQQGYGTYRRQQTAAPQAAAPTNQVSPNQAYNSAVAMLMNFDKGTTSHQKSLNNCLTMLSKAGHNTADPAFIGRLVEDAQSRRENREPSYEVL